MLHPSVGLPDHLRANERGTFTEDSVIRRLPEIARRTSDELDLEEPYHTAVETLAAEVNSGAITQVDEPNAPDAGDWFGYVEPYEGMSWLDVPWFFAETYFYRRLLAATGYSQNGSRKSVDPFAFQKRTALDGAARLAAALEQIDDMAGLLHAALWANSVDLSLWPADDDDAADRIAAVLGSDRTTRLLVDDTSASVERLSGQRPRAQIVLDNAGAELIADLAVAAQVLRRDGTVTFHAKPHPTFVSDVTPDDLLETIELLAGPRSPAPNIGGTLLAGKTTGNLTVQTHPFWVSPLPFWRCPSDLVDQLSGADLVVVKGDANYRRLLGDLHWDPTTPFAAVVRPLQPTVAIRTSKSLVEAGLTADTIARASNTDPDWMVNGEWGMIQLAEEVS